MFINMHTALFVGADVLHPQITGQHQDATHMHHVWDRMPYLCCVMRAAKKPLTVVWEPLFFSFSPVCAYLMMDVHQNVALPIPAAKLECRLCSFCMCTLYECVVRMCVCAC